MDAEKAEKKGISRESGIQGRRWKTLHQGYFSHLGIADPLLAAAVSVIAEDRPTVVADVGGGTGFVLQQLAAQHGDSQLRLVDVDLSAKQLAEVGGAIETLEASALNVRREDLAVGNGRLVFLMRSLLHYFGRAGLTPVLQHLRHQMKPGEALVHQTACFADPRDAACANRLYEMMGTDKWYPTEDELRGILGKSGWHVAQVHSAPPLALESADLSERYQLSETDVESIRSRLEVEFGATPAVFVPKPGGFIAWLHYAIFICRAA
ncbi:MAG: class I SAM-dependent methyltransferase [Planctomycetes bacterium]|nr:class I SAM-dependent methyltransferase [Planctomycetota bacterium]